MAGEDWRDHENDLIIADYFEMLQDDLSGKRYNKAEHNRQQLRFRQQAPNVDLHPEVTRVGV